MVMPSTLNLPEVGLNQKLCFMDLFLVQADKSCNLNVRGKPEFRLTVWMRYMDMNS